MMNYELEEEVRRRVGCGYGQRGNAIAESERELVWFDKEFVGHPDDAHHH